MTTEDTLKQFREMLYKYNSIPVTHRFGIEKKMIDKLESFLRDALDQAYVEAQKDLLKDYKKDIAQARQEERAYIGKQKREWYMRGAKEEREKYIGICLCDCKDYRKNHAMEEKDWLSLPLKKEELPERYYWDNCPHCGRGHNVKFDCQKEQH